MSVVMVLVLSACVVANRAKVTTEAEVLPEIILSVPENPVHREYLGLTQKKTFLPPHIDAQVLIIEIFSMYCPHCQREAPVINELYHRIEEDRKLRGRVKLIGIGVGNSPCEIGLFQKKYEIPFPLFSDEDFSIYRKLDEVATPYFICMQIQKNGTHRVFYKKIGGFGDPGEFLELIMNRSGQEWN
jgi:peroxiredoxin